ncbi:Hypothetical_protein [Hexamita inflata]|uniref:Hypothetical_protein n=1 Tax=Hexamita inflata TaxID=28002 RepID=A0AA86TQY1_9EUKA|nr:Hypothetical protein HINF_LOCUS11102 [Hexamita inflata]
MQDYSQWLVEHFPVDSGIFAYIQQCYDKVCQLTKLQQQHCVCYYCDLVMRSTSNRFLKYFIEFKSYVMDLLLVKSYDDIISLFGQICLKANTQQYVQDLSFIKTRIEPPKQFSQFQFAFYQKLLQIVPFINEDLDSVSLVSFKSSLKKAIKSSKDPYYLLQLKYLIVEVEQNEQLLCVFSRVFQTYNQGGVEQKYLNFVEELQNQGLGGETELDAIDFNQQNVLVQMQLNQKMIGEDPERNLRNRIKDLQEQQTGIELKQITNNYVLIKARAQNIAQIKNMAVVQITEINIKLYKKKVQIQQLLLAKRLHLQLIQKRSLIQLKMTYIYTKMIISILKMDYVKAKMKYNKAMLARIELSVQ